MISRFLLLFSLFALHAVAQEIACPTIPNLPYLGAKRNPKLPDPFTFRAGQRTTSKADWDCLREEISQILQHYELGRLPGPPTSVVGSFAGNILTVTVVEGNKTISFNATIYQGFGGAHVHLPKGSLLS